MLKQDIEMLTYALSIIPKESKNETFYNAVKNKFPYIEGKEFIGLSEKTPILVVGDESDNETQRS